MNRKNLNTSLRENNGARSRFASQCDTFRHLDTADSVQYNWARHYSNSPKDASARDIAAHINQLDNSILILLAESPNTSTNTLEVLAFSPSAPIRQAVADNPRTSQETLMVLARDEDPEVRYAMAENYNMKIDVLVVLCEDENPFVKVRAEETLSFLLCEFANG